jgi:outer membrane protein assembly factor BamB
MKVLWFDASLRWHKFRGQNQVRIAGGRLILLEEGLLRASDVYTGRKLWETEVPVGAKPLDSPIERERIRYQRHRSWGPPPHLAPTTEFVAVDDAIYVTQGTRCLVFEPNSGKPDGSIELPKGLDAPWSNLRVCGRYLVGSSGPHVLCFDRGERKLLWRTEASRAALSVAIGGDKVFCAELPNVRQGEDPVYDGTLLALKLASGERLWQRPGGARLRYSPDFDLVVTPINFYRAADGRPVLPENEAQQHRFVVQASGVSKPGLTGFVAGNRLLTGSEQVLQIYELPSAKPLGEPLRWVRRGCTATRASLHLLTTRYHGNSAWIDLATREITPLLGVRPACSVNNNLYPADGVLNVPNVTAGCTCNYMPVSAACVPAEAIEPGTGR